MARYNNSIETRINILICNIDENPVINSEEPEQSSYNGFKLRSSEADFQQQVQQLYNEFTGYLNEFLQENSDDSQDNNQVVQTLSRLLSLYRVSLTDIKESPKRIEWRSQSKYFTIANPEDDYIIEKRINYIRESHKFFLKMSGIQMLFLERLIDYIVPQVEAYKFGNTTSDSNSSASKSNQLKNKPKKKVPFFTVKPDFCENYNIYLNNLYEGLSSDELGYIDCTPYEFKKLFRPWGRTPNKAPDPIIWTSGAYSHLAYFVKCLKDEHFIPNSKHPSFYQIAKQLFYDEVKGNYFSQKGDKIDETKLTNQKYPEIKNMVWSKLKRN